MGRNKENHILIQKQMFFWSSTHLVKASRNIVQRKHGLIMITIKLKVPYELRCSQGYRKSSKAFAEIKKTYSN